MSCWTHITCCMSIDTYTEEKSDKLLKQVQKYIDKAPKITGSEGNADIFLNIQSGYNIWIGADCNKCKYKSSYRQIEGNTFICDAPDGYKCPSGEYQTCIVLSIQGDLRDRTSPETQKEFNDFLKYIEKKYDVRDYAVNIEGD